MEYKVRLKPITAFIEAEDKDDAHDKGVKRILDLLNKGQAGSFEVFDFEGEIEFVEDTPTKYNYGLGEKVKR